jgi:feruloyl esterase
VINTLQTDLSNNYLLFMIPGMSHCAGVPDPWILFNNNPAGAALDQTADLVTQLIRWVEVHITPGTLLGTKHVKDTGVDGSMFQRPVCPYPTEAV